MTAAFENSIRSRSTPFYGSAELDVTAKKRSIPAYRHCKLGERHPDRPNVAARKVAQRAQNGRNQKFAPLSAKRSRHTNRTDLQQGPQALSQFFAHSLVGDPGIPSEERQGFA